MHAVHQGPVTVTIDVKFGSSKYGHVVATNILRVSAIDSVAFTISLTKVACSNGPQGQRF